MNLFEEYGQFHRDTRNRLCHEIGIPLIVLAVVAWMRLLHFGDALNLALVAGVAVSIYYVILARANGDIAAAVWAIVGLAAIYVIAAYVAWPLAAVLFVAGWIFQFVGHAYEGQKPAFLKNLTHLLVGPLWIAHLIAHPHPSSSSVR
jgi:uncharacterized membrane protein YGL010W